MNRDYLMGFMSATLLAILIRWLLSPTNAPTRKRYPMATPSKDKFIDLQETG